jgi:hypothetical protein
MFFDLAISVRKGDSLRMKDYRVRIKLFRRTKYYTIPPNRESSTRNSRSHEIKKYFIQKTFPDLLLFFERVML